MSASPARFLEFEIQRLGERAEPAMIVDVAASRLLAANNAGMAVLGLGDMPRGGVAIDRAMPAIEDLSRLVVGARAPVDRTLVFWTPKGPRALDATCTPLTSVGNAIVRIVRVVRAVDAEAENAKAEPSDTAADRPVDDAGTMVEIARRIREGLGGGLLPSEPRRVVYREAQPAPPELPESDETGVVTGVTTADHVVDWSGLKVLSERDFATLAHELRTPLAAIVALAEVMRDEKLGASGNPKYAEYAADIHTTAEHALAVIATLLEGDGATGAPGPIDANAIVSGCLSALRPMAKQAGITMVSALAAGLPPIVAEPRAIKQILLNLLSNALRHTQAGGEIAVSTAYRVDGPVRIEVRDTGCGITEAELAAIEAEIAAEQSGQLQPGPRSGLGLPLVRRLAIANGAEFGFDSQPGRGLRAFITFGRDRVATAIDP